MNCVLCRHQLALHASFGIRKIVRRCLLCKDGGPCKETRFYPKRLNEKISDGPELLPTDYGSTVSDPRKGPTS
jgi:hypothetical protein